MLTVLNSDTWRSLLERTMRHAERQQKVRGLMGVCFHMKVSGLIWGFHAEFTHRSTPCVPYAG